jgi:hypothetical protein
MREDVMRVARLLENDVARTLGERNREIVTLEAEVVAMLDGPSLDDVLVDHVQQVIHHEVNSTWPACPLHAKHPLWYEDGAWYCTTDHVQIAQLGRLGA